MGQYYIAIILGEKNLSSHEIIRIFMPIGYGYGMKLTEHAYINCEFISTFESLLTPEGMFYKSRVVWAGDYADKEPGLEENLYSITDKYPEKELLTKTKLSGGYKYIINHTKKLFINKDNHTLGHPLPLLTAEGNGRGGGDYRGINEELVGTWARDVISIEKYIDYNDYTEFVCEFTT